jgi:hypothetical protein
MRKELLKNTIDIFLLNELMFAFITIGSYLVNCKVASMIMATTAIVVLLAYVFVIIFCKDIENDENPNHSRKINPNA